MAGLAAAAGQPPAAPMADEPQGEEVSPEEQALYDQFVKFALYEIIYPKGGDSVSPEVLANLKGDIDPQATQMFAEAQPPLAQSPQDSLSATAVLIAMVTDGQGKASGTEYPDDVVMHGGVAVIEELIEVAEAAKIHDFSEQDIEGITFRAMDLFRTASPRVDQEALKAEFGMIVEADKAGTLGKVLPGLPGGAPMPQGG